MLPTAADTFLENDKMLNIIFNYIFGLLSKVHFQIKEIKSKISCQFLFQVYQVHKFLEKDVASKNVSFSSLTVLTFFL